MIRSADSELATNRCWSLGATGELRAFCGFAHSDSLIRLIISLSAQTATSQTVPVHKFHTHMHPRRPPLPGGTDHSKPIGRSIVERFSPTRF
jgi:hypothetical protein